MTKTTITNYNQVLNNCFDTMDVIDEMPEFWWENPRTDIIESAYWQAQIRNDFKEEHGYTNKQIDDAFNNTHGELENKYNDYESEYVDSLLNAYVIYKVTGDNLDKLPDYIGVYWIDELDSYVFLQGWYGMAPRFLECEPFEWDAK